MSEAIFERREIKYLLTHDQYEKLLDACGTRLLRNHYFESNIQSLYFDTGNYRLIRQSLEGMAYKEKIRVRSYGDFSDDAVCFLEVKKKYLGKTYKRRVSLLGKECKEFIKTGVIPARLKNDPGAVQILSEMRYSLEYYGDIKPRCLMKYHRYSYELMDSDLPPADAESLPRLTFDDQISYGADFDYFKDISDDNYVGSKTERQTLIPDLIIMEYKGDQRMPLWFTEILTKLQIVQGSFSKYGTAYKEGKLNNE